MTVDPDRRTGFSVATGVSLPDFPIWVVMSVIVVVILVGGNLYAIAQCGWWSVPFSW